MKPQIFFISLLGLSFVSAQNLFDTGYGVQIPYSGNGASSAYNSYGYNKYNNNQEAAESGSGDPLRRALGLWGRLLNKMAQPSPPTDDELRLRALNANQQVDDGLEYEQPYQQPYQQPSLGQLGAGIAAKAIKNIQSAGLLNGLYKQENNQEIPNSLLNRLDGPGSLIDPKRLEQILPRTIEDAKKTESTTTTTEATTTTTTTESTTSTSTTTTEASTTEEPTTTTKPERTTKKATKKTTTSTAATTTTTEEPKETEKPRKKSPKRAKSVEKTTRQPKSEEYMEDEEEEMLKKSRFSLRTTVRTEDEAKTTKKVKITTTVKPTTNKPKVKTTEVTTKKVITTASTTTPKPRKESKKEHKGLEKIREEEEYDDEEYSEGSGEEYEEITTTTTVKPKHSKNRSKEKRKSSEKKAKTTEEKRKKEDKKAKSDEEKRKMEEKESDSDVTVLKFIDENIPEAEEEQNQFQRDEVPQTTTLAPIEIPTFTLNPKAFEMSDSKLNNVISQAGTIIDGVGPLILPLLGFSRTAAGAAFAQPTFGAAAAAAAPARVAGVRSYKPSAKSDALQPLPSVEAPAEVEQTGFQHTQPSEPSRPIPYRRKAEKMYPKSSTPPPVKLPTADELRQRQEFENSIIDGERQRLLKQKAELEKRTQQIEEQRQLQLQLQEEHRRLQIQKQIELMKLEEERKRLQEDQVLPVGNKPSLDRLVASDTATGPIPRYLGDNAPEVNEAALLEAYRTIFEHNRQKIINPDVVVPPAEVQEKISEIRRQPTPDDPGYKLGRNQVSNMFYEDSGLMVGTQPSDSGVIALTNAVGGGGFGNGRRPDTVPFA